jgi:hypothetical protein
MILEIIKISSAIILGFIALGIIAFIIAFISWTIIGVIQGVKEGIKDVYYENGVSSFKELLEKKKKEKTNE